jgi:hypothetical protein
LQRWWAYDFGDSWEHSIFLEKQLPVDLNTVYPVCADSKLLPVRPKTAAASRAFMTFSMRSPTPTMNGMRN